MEKEIKEIQEVQQVQTDLMMQNEDNADCRHDQGEASADSRCSHITHQISNKAWMIIGIVAVLGANSIRMHYSWKGDVDKAHKQISKLEKSVKKGSQVVVWFDRQRQYKDKHFEQIDSKYPAQYERWAADGGVIERWHWRVEGKPETYRFGNRIQRCVAIYKKGQFVGYRAYSMEDYPTEDFRPAAENRIKSDSLVLRVIGSRKEISHVGGIGWSLVFEEGKFKCLRKNDLNGVKKTFEPDLFEAIGMFNLHDYDRDDLYQIASENEDLEELHFTALLQEDKENFKRLAALLPLETRDKWDIYAEWEKANPDKTLNTVSNE
tara:strand:+ start:116 stop:1078 length:963 start_codon:yes stop_codon:yes gene_type:complete